MRSIRIILAIAAKDLRILARMPAILLVIFVPGIVMYSVFTKIFEGPAGRPFRAAVVDLDQSQASHDLIAALERSNVVLVRNVDEEDPASPLLTVETASEHIRRKGQYRVAVVIPKGFGEAPNSLYPGHVGVRMIYDETQPVEANLIAGLLQLAAGRNMVGHFAALSPGGAPTTTPADGGDAWTPIRVEKSGVAITRMQMASKHTFLAGIVPMFVLFGATGAARSLLDAMQSGEIARMLAAPIKPAHVMVGSMMSSLVTAMLQCYAMYVFAWLVFGVHIWEIGGGLFVLTLCTCLACMGFGMMLGSLCRTSQHLDSIGTIVILAMSAIGGSMVPRIAMPPFMLKLGLFTINGWAYEGFLSLIREEGFGLSALVHGEPRQGIWLHCTVLLAAAVVLTTIGSAILSRRVRR